MWTKILKTHLKMHSTMTPIKMYTKLRTENQTIKALA